MTSPTIRIREHDKVAYSKLPSGAVDELEQVVQRSRPRILTFHRDHLRSHQYAGVIQTSSVTLEIVPKADTSGAGLLLALLRLTNAISLNELGQAGLQRLNGSFLQVWIEHFARRLHNLLHRQFDQQYREIERRTGFIRGRLCVEDMRHGQEVATGTFPCRYDVYTPDHLMNQVLLRCAQLLEPKAEHPYARRLLRQCCARLDGVSRVMVSAADVERVQLSRLNDTYAPILRLCRLLLDNATASMQAGPVDQVAVTFDMNQLFELAIGTLLHKHRAELTVDGHRIQSVELQPPLGRLFGEFPMRVDIVITDDRGEHTLIDTKYKTLDSSQPHGGLSQSDVYQMYAYANAGDRTYDRVILLHPGKRPIRRRFEANGTTLFVRTVDLDRFTVPNTDRLDRPAVLEALGRALQL